jgi:hypothetical protein
MKEDFLARYQRLRRPAEIGFWVAVLVLQAVTNSLVMAIDLRQSGREFAAWEPWLWEATSNLVVGLLIPAMLLFERRFPLRWDTLPRNVAWHLLGSVLFCVLHVVLMMGMRLGVYSLTDVHYDMGSWTQRFGYEFLKDLRSYALILSTILGYRLLMLRLQGEARVLDAPDTPVEAPSGAVPAAAPARPERFLVRKLRKEFLIAAGDISWLQAQGNYIGLHVNGHDYLVRSTLAEFLEQLDPARFARVHRSWAVNLDRIAEIEPLDGGDARLLMPGGFHVPCSRRYRDALGR